jgi:hypothetical protein
MAQRKTLSKKLRLEVFKRDKFTCQYCGRSAPDVVLEADHIQPVSKDGDDDILNLVTSCRDCNAGKGARELSDESAVTKRRAQLEDLQERREQIEMMLEWQAGLEDLTKTQVDGAAELWTELVPGYELNAAGLADLDKFIRRFGLSEVLESMRIAASQYIEFSAKDGKATLASINLAWKRVRGICAGRQMEREEPDRAILFHARNILRQRCIRIDELRCMELLEEALDAGIPAEKLRNMTRRHRSYREWQDEMDALLGTCRSE